MILDAQGRPQRNVIGFFKKMVPEEQPKQDTSVYAVGWSVPMKEPYYPTEQGKD